MEVEPFDARAHLLDRFTPVTHASKEEKHTYELVRTFLAQFDDAALLQVAHALPLEIAGLSPLLPLVTHIGPRHMYTPGESYDAYKARCGAPLATGTPERSLYMYSSALE